jgi:2-polyprenyl-3-methyl-5-hydroxy-6-metoxy-1,4-benzoquinol methylase
MRLCPNCHSKEHSGRLKEGEHIIVRCDNCSLLFLLNIPDEKEIYEDYYKIEFTKEDYNAESKYPYLADIFEINRQRIQKLNQLQKALKSTGKKILDIGCGSGLFLKTAKDEGYETYGIDISANALKFAKEEFGLNAEAKSTEDIINEEKKFDIITLWHVLEHFLNPVKELISIKDLLSPGGYIFIEVPNFNSAEFRLSGYKWKGGNHPKYHRTFFSNKTLEETLMRSGFGNFQRIQISYQLPARNPLFNSAKKFFNAIAMDAFLDYTAYNREHEIII